MFLWGRKDGHSGGLGDIAPLAAVTAMQRMPAGDCYGYGHGNYEHWDIVRDELREFGNLKKEGAENSWRLSRENDKNHYDASRQICDVRYDLAMQADKNYRDPEKRMDEKFFAMERGSWERERGDLRDKIYEREIRLNGDRVIGALAPKPIPHCYPVHGPSPYPYHGCEYGC